MESIVIQEFRWLLLTVVLLDGGNAVALRDGRLAALRAAPDAPDYLITDSADLEKRPPLVSALANPRDALAVTLLLVGGRISLANVVGAYDDAVERQIREPDVLVAHYTAVVNRGEWAAPSIVK